MSHCNDESSVAYETEYQVYNNEEDTNQWVDEYM